MLNSHLNRRMILGPIAGIGAILLSGVPGFAVDGPSFDCTQGVNSALATILCSAPEAARADWDLVSAYWAFSTDDRDQRAFSQSMNERCALPQLNTAEEAFAQELGRTIWGHRLPVPGPQPITQNHVRCVITAFHNQAAMLRSKLKGDALAESNLRPEELKEIQVALIEKGFLRKRFQNYAMTPDGKFGPNTRSAIKDFQRSIGARDTGVLSDIQRRELLESPQEREARKDRAEAEARARQDALDAQRRAEEQAKRDEDKRAEAEARARKEALDAQRRAEEQAKRDKDKAEQDAIDREKKRLEDEAKKAEVWREKIEEAKTKGTEYAARTRDITWSLTERINPMTEENEYTVSSTQPNGSGAAAIIKGVCLKDQVVFHATLQDANDPTRPLGFITAAGGAVIGNKRINDDYVFATTFPTFEWRNRIVVSTLSFTQYSAKSADTTWRAVAEIETSQGTVYIKIPMLNAKIQTLITSCQRHYELEKRRDGRRDAPA
jgi:peptidoglycan hydrolase-like protein with peptidoglycan-binding domain